MRISDWSSDVCSSDLLTAVPDTQRTWLRFADGHFSGCNMFYLATPAAAGVVQFWRSLEADRKHPLKMLRKIGPGSALCYLFGRLSLRSEEHTSELQSLMRISYAVFCLKKQTINT